MGSPALAIVLLACGQSFTWAGVPVEVTAVAARAPKSARGRAKEKGASKRAQRLEETPLDRRIVSLRPGEPTRIAFSNGAVLFLSLGDVDPKARVVRLHERVLLGDFAYERDDTVRSGAKSHLSGGTTADGGLVLVSVCPKLP